MKKYLIGLLCLYATVAAAESQTGKIVGYLPYSSGESEMIIFKLQSNAQGGCNSSARYALGTSSIHFKTTRAAIMAAYHAQSDVTVSYSQTCNVWANSWDVNYVCNGLVNC